MPISAGPPSTPPRMQRLAADLPLAGAGENFEPIRDYRPARAGHEAYTPHVESASPQYRNAYRYCRQLGDDFADLCAGYAMALCHVLAE